MQRIAQRGLVWIIALALVVAGLPMAHAMPDASAPIQIAQIQTVPIHAAMQHQADVAQMSAADHAHHHHEGMAMDVASDQNDDGQPQSSAPCKCLNCSMCVASFVAASLRLSTPERRIVAVTYALAPAGIPGIAVRVDPGIPILAV